MFLARLGLGNLENGGIVGLWILNGNNGTGNTRWNIGTRQSGFSKYFVTTTFLHCEKVYLAQLSKIVLNDHRVSSILIATTRLTTRNGNNMKSYCKGLVVDEALVKRALERWLSAPAGRKNSHRVTEEYSSPHELVQEIYTEIYNRRLTFAPIHRFVHIEPTNGKKRIIGVQSIKQQIVDYLAVEAMETFLQAKLGYYQAASSKGKGQLFTARALRKWSYKSEYWVHVDARQCYPSIDHEILMGILKKYIKSSDILYIARTLLETYSTGLDIGSYFSLRMAQLVLSFAYHFNENQYKIRRDKRKQLITHQVWYMDDAILLSNDKRDLRQATRSLEKYMKTTLHLELKLWKICKVSDQEPIDLAGYVIRPNSVTLRSGIFLRAHRAYREYNKKPSLTKAARVCSYWGWIKHSNIQPSTSIVRTYESARAML